MDLSDKSDKAILSILIPIVDNLMDGSRRETIKSTRETLRMEQSE